MPLRTEESQIAILKLENVEYARAKSIKFDIHSIRLRLSCSRLVLS